MFCKDEFHPSCIIARECNVKQTLCQCIFHVSKFSKITYGIRKNEIAKKKCNSIQSRAENDEHKISVSDIGMKPDMLRFGIFK